MYLHDDNAVFSRLVQETADAMSNSYAYVLKDYFAVMFLKEAIKANPQLVFKGGTCLSKCHKVIERFSEDIDLGIAEEHATEGMRKRMKSAVVSASELLGLSILNLDSTRSRREFNRFEIVLPEYQGQREDVLLVETATMTPAEPSKPMPIQSFVGEYCAEKGYVDVIEDYELGPYEVQANSLERTFCDKVFAVCDYYLSGSIPQRQSRHIYDLYKLAAILPFDGELAALFERVRRQRQGGYRCPSAEPGVDVAGVLRTIESHRAYEQDYNEDTLPLLYEDVAYDKAVEALLQIAEFFDPE